MMRPKHVGNAPQRIDEYIQNLPAWSRAVCARLREIVLKSDPKIIEDWKWGPNYYLEGMVAGFAAFKKQVNFVFFRGAHLKDERKILNGDSQNLNIRSLRFSSVTEINEDHLLEYLMEAIDNNKKGLKPNRAAGKAILIPPDIKRAFKKAGVLATFEASPYSHKKEYLAYIEEAKKQETRLRRIEKAISKLGAASLKYQIVKKN
jgi:uncharacterized protein YdeI (YjbR/CyaY-like superfamily)